MARPAKPLYAVTPVDEAVEELADGVLSLDGAAEFTSLSRDEIERAVSRGELETFRYGRRVLLVKRHVMRWLAEKLAAARREREGR